MARVGTTLALARAAVRHRAWARRTAVVLGAAGVVLAAASPLPPVLVVAYAVLASTVVLALGSRA